MTKLLIDCDTCVVRGLRCGECVFSVILDETPAGGWLLDHEEQSAVQALADSGMVPRLAFGKSLKAV